MGIFEFFKRKNKSNQSKQELSAESMYPAKANNIEPAKNSNSNQPKLHTFTMVFGRRIDISTPEGQRAQQILEQCEILKESASKINESDNLNVVLKGCTSYENALEFLIQCQNADLKSLNLKLSEQFQEMYDSWRAKKVTVINSAILRAYESILLKVSLLKTNKGKLNRINLFVENSLILPGLLPENIVFLKELPEKFKQSQRTEHILNQYEILKECVNTINTSADLAEILKSINTYEQIYDFIIHCSPEDLKASKLSPPQKHIAAYEEWLQKKTNVINEGICRACTAQMDTAHKLSNENEQFAHMNHFFNTCLKLTGLLQENITLLKSLQAEFIQPAEDSFGCDIRSLDKHIETVRACEERINNSGNVQIVAQNIRILLETLNILKDYSLYELEAAGYQFNNGSPAEWYEKINTCKHQIITQVPSRPTVQEAKYTIKHIPEYYSLYEEFYSYGEKYNSPSSTHEKLQYCKKALKLLPDIVLADLEQDGKLIRIPEVCYVMPEMYMRIGEWEKAKETVKYCIACNAYYSEPEVGESELSYIETFQETALVALEFIKNNPGFLQKNMYKALADKTDHDCLKHFLRCSEQIEKIPYKKTNMLYVANMQP
ncbi:MAG: hypothetical protein Q4C59_10275 [Lachnospiraceae bacterium]|nr:hypothetical protein [Lachnospiraceae bacterium]